MIPNGHGRGLSELGIPIHVESERWIVDGSNGIIEGGGELSLGESGTSFRFLLAVAALGAKPSRLDGAGRLQERPIAELAAALSGLGTEIKETWPMVAGGSSLRGGRVSLPGGRSSQFASAMLLIGSHLPGGLELTLEPPLVSMPYVQMTADCLVDFGVNLSARGEAGFHIVEGDYAGREITIEGDHSSASYFLAAPAIVGGRVRLDGLRPSSRQPDSRLGAILEELGCSVRRGQDWVEVEGSGELRAFDLDLAEAPDVVPTVAVLGLFAEGASRIRGVPHLRDKESDRLEMLARNLCALGRTCRVTPDGLEIGRRPGATPRSRRGDRFRSPHCHGFRHGGSQDRGRRTG